MLYLGCSYQGILPTLFRVALIWEQSMAYGRDE